LSIGILLVQMPRMLHDVVGNILGVEPDLRVVADEVEVGALVERVEREHPDVVMLCVEAQTTPQVCEELLGRFPGLTVVALEDLGQRASIYMMRPMRIRLAEISRTQLVNAIRRAAGPVPFPMRLFDAGSHLVDTLASRGAIAGHASEAGRGQGVPPEHNIA
jgi:chemotaxis response regulator CheB